VVDAKKEKIGERAALALVRTMQRLVVARGKKVVTFDLRKDRPANADIAAIIMGPSGNLRAPTLKIGTTLVVGFNDEAYGSLLG
jgi:hypothetical protein